MQRGIEMSVQELIHERAIISTLNRYCSSIDYGDLERFLDCFTEDAVWRRRFRRSDLRPPVEFRGHAELAEFFARHTHAPDYYHKHLTVQPEIDINGARATVRSYFVRIDENPEGPFIRAFGRYQDTMVKGAGDQWRFRERLAEGEDWNPKPFPPV
jgi:SnoaL-like domain